MKRLLIVGCGDVGVRMLPLLRGRYRLFALTRSGDRDPMLRAMGVTPLTGDLDDAQSLSRLSGLPHDVLHFAPPPRAGARDWRTGNLIRALQKARSIPQRLVYISTSGVYGDCGGRLVHEHATVRPQTDRALRRVDAEALLSFMRESRRLANARLRRELRLTLRYPTVAQGLAGVGRARQGRA